MGNDLIRIAGSADPVHFQNILKYGLTKCNDIIIENGLSEFVNISRRASPQHLPAIIGRGLPSCVQKIREHGIGAVGEDLISVFNGEKPRQVKDILNCVLFDSDSFIDTKNEADMNNLHVFFSDLIAHNSAIFVRAFLIGLPRAKAESFKHLETLADRAKEYWEKFGKNQYAYKIISEGLGKLPPLHEKTVRRLSFEKTGSDLVPLAGGQLTGYLIRIITKESFEAWKRVFDAGIPCEEIIKFYDRNDGTVAVATRCCGERFDYFINEYPGFERAMRQQRNYLQDEMIKNSVFHGHTHSGNFCIKMENRQPYMRVIDFDQAESIPD
jgi:hypothetical protein